MSWFDAIAGAVGSAVSTAVSVVAPKSTAKAAARSKSSLVSPPRSSVVKRTAGTVASKAAEIAKNDPLSIVTGVLGTMSFTPVGYVIDTVDAAIQSIGKPGDFKKNIAAKRTETQQQGLIGMMGVFTSLTGGGSIADALDIVRNLKAEQQYQSDLAYLKRQGGVESAPSAALSATEYTQFKASAAEYKQQLESYLPYVDEDAKQQLLDSLAQVQEFERIQGVYQTMYEKVIPIEDKNAEIRAKKEAQAAANKRDASVKPTTTLRSGSP